LAGESLVQQASEEEDETVKGGLWILHEKQRIDYIIGKLLDQGVEVLHR